MRRSKRIDYRTFNSTGVRVVKLIDTDSDSVTSEASNAESLGESVNDNATDSSDLLTELTELSTRLHSVSINESSFETPIFNESLIQSNQAANHSCVEGTQTIDQNSDQLNQVVDQCSINEIETINQNSIPENRILGNISIVEIQTSNQEIQIIDQTSSQENYIHNQHLTQLTQTIDRNPNQGLDLSCTEEMSSRQAELLAVLHSIAEDIDDHIDENPQEDACSSEIDSNIKKVEELRTSYRVKHNEFKSAVGESYEESLNKNYESRLSIVKNYILFGKQIKKQMKEMDAKLEIQLEDAEKSSQKRSSDFFVSEISKLAGSLVTVFDLIYCKDLTDDKISKLKNELPDKLKQVENISKLIKDLLYCNKVCDKDMEAKITKITEDYDLLCDSKDEFIKFINDEVAIRELSKKELFNEGKLKINLPKFGGYESKLDVYSFQSEFIKLYERTTPKRLMSDMLKNNFLEGSALSLVSSLDNIDEIWQRLKSAYGDAKLLLKKKLGEVDKINLWKVRDPERIGNMLSKIINTMKDLMKLASEHKIEARLYSGDGLERIYLLMGDARLTKWLSEITRLQLSDKQLWIELIVFLENDLKVQQQKLLLQNKFDASNVKIGSKGDSRLDKYSSHFAGDSDHTKCKFCDEKDHVATVGPNGTKIIQYFACKRFAEMTPNERFLALQEKGYCIQCLFPGASQDKGKHEKGHCQRDFTCQHHSHARYPVKKHVLICHEHRNAKENQQLLESYKIRCINKSADLPPFSREIKLSFHVSYNNNGNQGEHSDESQDCNEENAIYMLQNINVDNKYYSIFYDTGCSEMVSKYEAIKSIGSRATQEQPGPIVLGGVGNSQVTSQHGIYQVRLPLFNGEVAKLSGVCMDEITAKFPMYPLQGDVEKDIKIHYKNANKDMKLLPKLPKSVGGNTDFMIGIKYYRYYPELIFQLPSGLAIYKSLFLNPDGSRGVVGGPHKIFTEINTKHYDSMSFITSQYAIFRYGYQVNPDISLLHFKANNDFLTDIKFDDGINILSSNNDDNLSSKNSFIIRRQKMFQMVEDAGSEISYRCSKCRSCKDCKHHENIENISVREEVEQDLIDRSVTVDINQRITIASLPFIHDPSAKLANNKETALRVYNQQLKRLDKNPKDKTDVLKSEATLQSMNFVEYVKNLPPEDQEMLEKSPVKYYIPWRVVWNQNSVSTPCRPVFDASQATSTGFSLNDVLAKGKNNMNRLVEVVIRWFSYLVAFHTDIKKMYNSVHLRKEDWCYQRYIWQEELDKGKLPVAKVIKTLIYE